jgi:ABC-type lipoprotein release transport system permease subunit
MRPKQLLKSLFRTPFKTILTFLLIAAASFALFSRVTDYAVTSREMKEAVSHYRGVVALNNSIPDSFTMYHQSRMPASFEAGMGWYNLDRTPVHLEPEQIELISNLPGVTLAETRYMTGGLIREHERFYRYGDLNFGFNYNARYIIEGTLAAVEITGRNNNMVHLYFDNSELLAGNYPLGEVSAPDEQFSAPYDFFGFSGNVFHVMLRPDAFASSLNAMGDPDLVFYYNPLPWKEIENLKIGSRYVFTGLYSELVPSFTRLGCMDTHEYFNFMEITELESSPEMFSRLQNLIDIIEKDLHTFDIVYTTDMRAIPRVNEQRMALYEGRFLTTEDSQNNAQVCVVNHSFFYKNNLSIGDKFTIELGDKLFMQHAGMGAITYIPERTWNVVETVELEIVGVYMDTESPFERASSLYWTYHPCTVFVPMSFLPVEVPADHEVWAGEFSVLIENPHDIDAFFETAPKVTDWIVELEWDYTLPHWETGAETHFFGSKLVAAKWRFSDLGWARVKDSINASQTASLVTTTAFATGVALALLLAVYLYIGRNKKTFAVMRALGVTRAKSRNSLAFPLVVLSALAIPLGGIMGLVYTSRTVTPMLEELSANVGRYTANASIPVSVVILCLFGTILYITLLSALFLWKMGRIPPLELLQGDVIKIHLRRDAFFAAQSEPPPIISFTPIPKTELPERGKYSAFKHVTAYILRHMSRVKWKTAISLTLAVALTGAIGVLAITRLFYKDLFGEVTVTATTTNFSTSTITELFDSDLTENLYYISDYVVFFGDTTDFAYSFTLTNDFGRVMEELGGGYVIEWAEGYSDADFFAESNLFSEENLCIIGANFGVKPGDTIALISGDWTREREAVSYKVVAVIESEILDRRDIGERIYAPLSASVINLNMAEHFVIDYIEFTLTENERSAEFLTMLDRIKDESQLYSITAEYNAETDELDNIRRVRDLLILLFPIALAGAVLIGLTAPGLIIIQSAKEAAILRVLGVTKKRARCMLMFEQIGLCVVGIALAAGGLLLYNSGLFSRSAETLAVCGVLYLLGCVCAAFGASVSVTRRRILELLQVKE